MIESERRAYLEAMGIDVWVSRLAGPAACGIIVGPGSGSTLLICNDPTESATRLAADIARAIEMDSVWGWPDTGEDGGSPAIATAINQGMFTSVLFFGRELADRMFGGKAPQVLGSAEILVAGSMNELAAEGGARRSLWRLITARSAAARREGAS